MRLRDRILSIRRYLADALAVPEPSRLHADDEEWGEPVTTEYEAEQERNE